MIKDQDGVVCLIASNNLSLITEGGPHSFCYGDFLSKSYFMQQHIIQVSFDEYQDSNALNSEDATLLNSAKDAIELSYAPYSRFQVGAAARLSNCLLYTSDAADD